MLRRAWLTGTGVLILFLAVIVPPAFGANQTVSIVDIQFLPAQVAVQPGQVVTWENAGTNDVHNVHFEDPGVGALFEPTRGPMSIGRTFPAVGALAYYCEVHGRPGGIGMSGVVYVNAPGLLPPIAVLQVTPVGLPRVGETVSFSAALSAPRDGGPIVGYEWDLDGDGSFETTTTVPTAPSRTYPTPGTRMVRLRVTDAMNLVSQVVTVPVRVAAVPTATFSVAPNPAVTGQPVSFNASASTDADGTVERHEWDLDGNGSYETDKGAVPTASRAYSSPGTVTVGLRVTDNDGISATTTRSLRVNAPPPPPSQQPQPTAPSVPCSSLTGTRKAACLQRICAALKGSRRAACIRKSCRAVPKGKRLACMRKSCRALKGSKKRACLRKYARRR